METPAPEAPTPCDAPSAKNRGGAALTAYKRAPPPQIDRLGLAETAAKLDVRLRSSDMPPSMQARAIYVARESLGSDPQKTRRLSPTKLAMSLKQVSALYSFAARVSNWLQEFDGVYGPAWHCIVGKSFGSFVTHASGGFIYFSVDSFNFLLFKTQHEKLGKSSGPTAAELSKLQAQPFYRTRVCIRPACGRLGCILGWASYY